MSTELLATKIIAPFYGTSLNVWVTVLSFSLGGLALGFFISAYVKNPKPLRLLMYMLSLCVVILLLIPLLSPYLLRITLDLPTNLGLIIGSYCLFLPLFICFGMISPLIIQSLSEANSSIGLHSGNIFAVSTLGGIIFIYLYSFWFIPYAGVRNSFFISSGLLIIPGIWFFFLSRIK